MAGFPHTAISWLCPLILLASVVDGATAESKLRLDVDVRYYYGQWQWGDYEMTPRAGQAGPDVRVHLPGGRWSLGTSYLSGDFSAAGASPLSDPRFRSRKNFAVEDGREELVLDLEFRPLGWLGVAAVYRFSQYELVSDVQLNSDQRLYGTGVERVVNEARGWGLSVRPRLPVHRQVTFSGELSLFPELSGEAAGRYQYQMLFDDNELDSRWFGRSSPRGFAGRGELTYALTGIPISLSAGFFFEQLHDRDPAEAGWLEDQLGGQTPGRSWLDDDFRGITARAGFTF